MSLRFGKWKLYNGIFGGIFLQMKPTTSQRQSIQCTRSLFQQQNLKDLNLSFTVTCKSIQRDSSRQQGKKLFFFVRLLSFKMSKSTISRNEVTRRMDKKKHESSILCFQKKFSKKKKLYVDLCWREQKNAYKKKSLRIASVYYFVWSRRNVFHVIV